MKLTPVFADLETFWSPTHTLTKMMPVEYCMHPDTEIISLAIKVGKWPTDVFFGEDNIRKVLAKLDWSDKYVIGHNLAEFDAMILAWRLGVKPAMWGCTQAMARPLHAKTTGLSLAALAKHYGIGEKNNAALVNTRGKHLADFTPAELEAMREYNRTDTDLCAALFAKLLPHTPKDELRLIDRTIRMLVEPQFECDVQVLDATLKEERARKRLTLRKLAVDLGHDPMQDEDALVEAARAELASSAKFAEFLRRCGVEPPLKPSPSDPEKQTYALAKTDEEFLALQEHENELVAAAAAARLGVKSTLLESRIERFLTAARYAGGRKPIALRYYGADTTGRWSGTFKMNDQNLPRVERNKDGSIAPNPKNALRLCLKAPKGKLVVVADLSGIELRVNMFLWRVPYAMELFQADPQADLYKPMAAEKFGVPIEQVEKPQRQVGKVIHLGCGFGAGGATFQKVARIMGGIELSLEEAVDSVQAYRRKHPEIVAGWRTCHEALSAVHAGAEVPIDPWGLCHTTSEGIKTPKGMIRYPGLRREIGDNGKTEWWYGEGRNRKRIYAGKVTENIVQHLARQVIADADLAMARTDLGQKYTLGLTVHDELVYVVDEADAEEYLATLQGIMRTPPAWWPELVTWSEGDIAPSYGEAK